MNFSIDDTDNITLAKSNNIDKAADIFNKVTALLGNIEKAYKHVVGENKPRGFLQYNCKYENKDIQELSTYIANKQISDDYRFVNPVVINNIEAVLQNNNWQAAIDYSLLDNNLQLLNLFNAALTNKIVNVDLSLWENCNWPTNFDFRSNVEKIQKDSIFINFVSTIFRKMEMWKSVRGILKYYISPDNGLIYLCYVTHPTTATKFINAIITFTGEKNYLFETFDKTNNDLDNDTIFKCLKKNKIKFFPSYLRKIVKFNNTSTKLPGIHDAYVIEFGYQLDDYSTRAIAYPKIISDFISKLNNLTNNTSLFNRMIVRLQDSSYNYTKTVTSKLKVGNSEIYPDYIYTSTDGTLQISLYLNQFDYYDNKQDKDKLNELLKNNCITEIYYINYKGLLVIEKLPD